MVVIGGGYIGLELSSVWKRLGSTVTVIEYLDHILPGMDKDISSEFLKILNKQGINFKLDCKVTETNILNEFARKETTLASYTLGMTEQQFLSEHETVRIFDKNNYGIAYSYKDCKECSEKYFTFIGGQLKAVTSFHYGLDKMFFE